MSIKSIEMLLVGCGSMGGALLKRWVHHKLGDGHVTVVTPHEESINSYREHTRVTWVSTPEDLSFEYKPDIIVFAVKPQILADVLPHYIRYTLEGVPCVTIAAGKELQFYEKYLGQQVSLVRVMPNLASEYGLGMTAAIANPNVRNEDIAMVDDLFTAAGKVLWLEDEALFHSVTSVSGCGPAYLYLLTQSLEEAARHVGVPDEMAKVLARQTIVGAGALLEHSEDSAEILKKRVASPGGVTEVALKVLENPTKGMVTLMKEALRTATEHSQEMAKGK